MYQYQGSLRLKVAQIVSGLESEEISREQLSLSLRQCGVEPAEFVEGLLEELLEYANSLCSDISPEAELENVAEMEICC